MSDLILPHAPVDVPASGLPIGDAAAACGITADTLRFYEKAGLLLHPAARDGAGRRRYDARDLSWLAGVVMLRETGMPVSDIRDMAELYRTPGADGERLALLERHRERILLAQERVRGHLDAIEAKIASYRSALHVDQS